MNIDRHNINKQNIINCKICYRLCLVVKGTSIPPKTLTKQLIATNIVTSMICYYKLIRSFYRVMVHHNIVYSVNIACMAYGWIILNPYTCIIITKKMHYIFQLCLQNNYFMKTEMFLLHFF